MSVVQLNTGSVSVRSDTFTSTTEIVLTSPIYVGGLDPSHASVRYTELLVYTWWRIKSGTYMLYVDRAIGQIRKRLASIIVESLLRQKAAHAETHNKMLRQEEKNSTKTNTNYKLN